MKALFKKWYFWVIAIIIVVIACCLFGGSGEDTASVSSPERVEISTEAEELIEGSKVTIDSCTFGTNYEGKKTVIISYTYTNIENSEATGFYVAFEDKAFQNGIELNPDYLFENEYSSNDTKNIKQGASIRVDKAYILNDETTDVLVEVNGLFSFDGTTISKTFAITE